MKRLAWHLFILFGTGTGTALSQARIPPVRTSGKTPCEVHPESAEATAQLWLDARTALEGSVADDSTAPALLLRHWRRTLTPSLRLIRERIDTERVTTRRPFYIPTPSTLERAGYIQRQLQSVIFYGPDPDEVLTERFLRRHCFRRIAGTGATEGLSGLAFEPLPRQDNPDVAGTLWIDEPRHELRYVEYRWTNQPGWAYGTKAEGRTEFVRLASGGWVIQRWFIRMPLLGEARSGDIDGYSDGGGELLAVGPIEPRKKGKP